MAIVVRSKLIPETYTPKSEIDADNPASFTLKPLNGLEYTDIMCHLIDDGDGNQRISVTGLNKLIKYGLVSAEGLTDEKGKQIKKPGAEMLDPVLLSEIATRILDISNISENERKN
jgi:hypothetical protein